MRLLICGGGTGGGVYPALTVLQTLASEVDLQTLWVGGVGGMEMDLVKRTDVPFETIPAAGVHGVGWRALPRNLRQLGRGYLASRRILDRFRPDVLFFTGGYLAVPMALAGRKIPSMLFVPDIEPGLALNVLARFAGHISVTAEDSRKYYPAGKQHRISVTGYPVRPDLRSWRAEEAREALGLSPQIPTLLVFGGSKGARSINRALLSVLPDLLADMQVVHVSGQLDWTEVQAAQENLDREQAVRYRAFPYLYSEMGAALAAADLALSRAGASTLGELPFFGLPAILVPYPYAWRYQQVNAQYLARNGAALVLADADLTTRLLPTVLDLMRDLPRREQMSRAMCSLAHPEAAQWIADRLFDLATLKDHERV